MKKSTIKLLKPLIWILTKVLGLVPGLRNVIKGIELDKKVGKLEKLGAFDEARGLRTNFLNKYPIKYLGPLWRSEGIDQLYNLKNYKKALEAFENAITCIEGESFISAMQYGVTQPIGVYYGAAAAAIYVSDKKRAEVYFRNFTELIERLDYKNQYQDQYDWLKNSIEDLKIQADNIDKRPNNSLKQTGNN